MGPHSLRPKPPAQLSDPELGEQGVKLGTLFVERQRGGSGSASFGCALRVSAFSCWHASSLSGISCCSKCCMSLWPYQRHYAWTRRCSDQWACLHQNWSVMFIWMPVWCTGTVFLSLHRIDTVNVTLWQNGRSVFICILITYPVVKAMAYLLPFYCILPNSQYV